MVWDVNEACPGHFLQIFNPLDKVTFITNSTKSYFLRNATKVYTNYCMGLRQFCGMYDIRYHWRKELSIWSLFKPIAEINKKVHSYCLKNNICNISAMHVRKTDLERELPVMLSNLNNDVIINYSIRRDQV